MLGGILMNLHIQLPGRLAKGRDRMVYIHPAGFSAAPSINTLRSDSTQRNINRHDGWLVTVVLLALTAASLAFWFRPFLTVLVIATSYGLYEITRSVARLCKVHARWNRLARRRHAKHV